MNHLITKNISIDIETFGNRPNGLIISIGAIAFSSAPADVEAGTLFSGKPEDSFYEVLNDNALEEETRFVKDPSMIRWWKETNKVAFEKLSNLMRNSTLDSEQLVTKFIAWLKPFCDQGYNIIGNSPSFDLVIIENACKVLGIPFPVNYRAETDYRTLTDLIWTPESKPRPGPNDAHDALFDAKFQAGMFAQVMTTVYRWKALEQLAVKLPEVQEALKVGLKNSSELYAASQSGFDADGYAEDMDELKAAIQLIEASVPPVTPQ